MQIFFVSPLQMLEMTSALEVMRLRQLLFLFFLESSLRMCWSS